MPTFSVVIPTYNRMESLKRAIDSVLSQTDSDYEVLVMDDGSTDDTRRIVESYGTALIRYDWQPNSGGPATPRNRGIDLARGEWIAFLDSDDVWYPQKLETMKREIAKDAGVDAFCSGEEVFYSHTGQSVPVFYGPYETDFYRAMLTGGNRCSTSAMVVRKSFLDSHQLRFNTAPDHVIVEDFDLWLLLARKGARFKFIDEILGRYVMESNNLSYNGNRMRSNLETVLREHVYSHQSFESDRDRLWRQVSVQIRIPYVKQLIGERKYFLALSVFARTTYESPLPTLSYLTMRFRQGLV